jgi:hypothetical protein
VNIVDALRDQNLFGALSAFRHLDTWRTWLVFLRAAYGLPLSEHDRALFYQLPAVRTTVRLRRMARGRLRRRSPVRQDAYRGHGRRLRSRLVRTRVRRDRTVWVADRAGPAPACVRYSATRARRSIACRSCNRCSSTARPRHWRCRTVAPSPRIRRAPPYEGSLGMAHDSHTGASQT